MVGNLGLSFAGIASSSADCRDDAAQRAAAAGALSSLQVARSQATQDNLQRAAAPAPTVPFISDPMITIVRPPSTGDGGLLGE